VRLAVIAAVVGVAIVPPAHAVTFSAAVPTGTALAELASADAALVALEPSAAAERLVGSAGGEQVSARLGIWELRGSAAARLVPRLERLGALRYAEPARARGALVRFTDPLSTPELGYHLYAVGANGAEPPGPGFPITIIDSGIDLAHPDFAGRPDTVSLNPQLVEPSFPAEYHGTAVGSTAAAAVNGVGAEGVYPQALIRTYDLPDLSDASVIAGIEAAIAAGPSVINMSLGGSAPSRAEYEVILRAVGTGSLVVAASGNELEQGNPILYPASYPHVVTVGATSRDGAPSVFSSASSAVDLVAPGEQLPLQHPTDPAAYVLESGTSFAAPIVSAAAAWVRTARGAMNPTQLADLLRSTAKDVDVPGFDERTGFGLLNIPAALAAPIPAVDPQEPNDDIHQVVADGLFPRAKPLVSPRLNGGLDATEDPSDVYRVAVPRGRKLTATVTGAADVRVALYGPTARTVSSTRSRLAVSDRAGRSVETVSYTNRGTASVVVFLHVRPTARAAVANPRYSVALTRVRAPARR
jgi:subtilisin family serine protease